MDDIMNKLQQLNMLIATSSWNEAQQKIAEIITIRPEFKSVSFLLVKYKSANNTILFKHIKKFTEEDFAIIEYELANSKSSFSEEIFEILYGSYKKVSLDVFSKILELVTKYKYKESEKKIKKIIDYSIKNCNFELFKLSLSFCKESDEKKIKYITKYSDNTTNNEEKTECLNISIKLGGDEIEATRKNLFHEIKKGTDLLQMSEICDKFLAEVDDKNLEIEKILDFISDKVETLAQIKLAKKIIYEYTQDKTSLKENIMTIASRALKYAYFDESQQLFKIIVDIDIENADAYLGICLSKAKIDDAKEIIYNKYPICETDEYKKYIFLVSESERKTMKSIFNLQKSVADVNKIENVEKEINQLNEDVSDLDKYIDGRPTGPLVFLTILTAVLFFTSIIFAIFSAVTSSYVTIAAISGIAYAVLTAVIICITYGARVISLIEIPIYNQNQNDAGVFYWLFFPLVMLFWVVTTILKLLIIWIIMLVILISAKKRKQNIQNKFGTETVLNPEKTKVEIENKINSLSQKLKKLKNTRRQIEQPEKILYKSTSILFRSLIGSYNSSEKYRNQSTYEKAKGMLIRAKTVSEYLEIEKLFNTIIEFRDSKELAQYAREKIKSNNN